MRAGHWHMSSGVYYVLMYCAPYMSNTVESTLFDCLRLDVVESTPDPIVRMEWIRNLIRTLDLLLSYNIHS